MQVNLKAPIHKHRRTTMERMNNFRRPGGLFRDTNLPAQLWGTIQPTSTLTFFPILGPHGSWKNYTHEQILEGPWLPVQNGQQFGPTWSTFWFHVVFNQFPLAFNGREIHFRFASGTEAMVYEKSADNKLLALQGISPGFREEMIVSKNWTPRTEPLEYYVEMACNEMFGAGAGDMIAPSNNNRFWNLVHVDLAVFNRDVFNLIEDLEIIASMSTELGEQSHIGNQAMFAGNEMVNLIKKDKKEEAAAISRAFFSEGGGAKSHVLHAMGHCHIDTAWLWPYDETIRKCARSFTAQMQLMDEFEGDIDYKFVCSSAQQFVWVKEYYPEIFAKMKEKVQSGNFIPVGGTWIEMDGNIPSGESFIRQYFYGQKFFEQEFGIVCREFWLPDTFGYSAQIPQMLTHVEIDRFLTQKMSWSLVNKFPNHNFWWEGIDGTKVLVHFPPGDGYNMGGYVNECLRSRDNSMDKGRCNTGVYLYGQGDGGGGPTRNMIERLKRMQNVDGLPKVVFSDSNTFFDELSKESDKFYKWVGELYLELHNGTYTSQARIKWYNRKCEFLLREVELLMAIAYSSGVATEGEVNQDMDVVDKAWQDVLLNQFHDVLPGSCIQFAAEDAWTIYRDVFDKAQTVRKTYNGRILGTPTTQRKVILNTLPWEVKTVIFSKPDSGPLPSLENIQAVTLSPQPFEDEGEFWFRVPSTFGAALVTLNPSGFTEYAPEQPTVPVSKTEMTWTNQFLTLEVQIQEGRPVDNLFFGGANKIPAYNDYKGIGINPGMFYIYDDIPLYWDAWDVMDYHLETRDLPDFSQIGAVEPLADGPIVGGYKWTATFGKGSTIERYTIMRADSPMLEYYTIIDWKEDHKMLKVEFPVDVLAREATFEIQYGHAKRPTHMNTSWEMAKFEVCGHKWIDISQADKGVSFITDSKYGWHVRGNHVQLSLLKAPKNPDQFCDMHKHYIYYAVLPHTGSFQDSGVVQKAYELNLLGCNNIPLLDATPPGLPINFVTSSNPAVVVETVKVSKPEREVTNTLCIRCYEAFGGYAKNTEIAINLEGVTGVFHSNGLERRLEPITFADGKFTADFKPFQIQSFLIEFN